MKQHGTDRSTKPPQTPHLAGRLELDHLRGSPLTAHLPNLHGLKTEPGAGMPRFSYTAFPAFPGRAPAYTFKKLVKSEVPDKPFIIILGRK